MNTLSITTPVINRFDPEILKSGTEQEKTEQLLNWSHGENNSIFVRWIPDEMLPNGNDDSVSRNFFNKFGIVNRIDFVPKFNQQGKQSGHIVFVHFDTFYESHIFVQEIVNAYPNAAEFEWSIGNNRYGTNKSFKLKCCVNTRPVVKVEFNASQLTDMIHNITAKLIAESETKDKLIEGLRVDNANLRLDLDNLSLKLEAFMMWTDFQKSSTESLCDKV